MDMISQKQAFNIAVLVVRHYHLEFCLVFGNPSDEPVFVMDGDRVSIAGFDRGHELRIIQFGGGSFFIILLGEIHDDDEEQKPARQNFKGLVQGSTSGSKYLLEAT